MFKYIISSFSNKFRKKRFDKFIKFLNIKDNDQENILDVGGTPSFWSGSGMEKNITLLNLEHSDNETSIKTAIGTACNMNMYDDGFFDIVFSNSVIEHVGDFQKQYEMAKEVDRVGNKYWIQTPNKHFPLEVHFCFPFLQYLPLKYQKFIVCYWPFSFAKMLILYGLGFQLQNKNSWLLIYPSIQMSRCLLQ
jgi:hypothetical protein